MLISLLTEREKMKAAIVQFPSIDSERKEERWRSLVLGRLFVIIRDA
jgi:hypothetical protein